LNIFDLNFLISFIDPEKKKKEKKSGQKISDRKNRTEKIRVDISQS
jgi:hypothetical protein